MSLRATVLSGRRLARSLMADVGRITRPAEGGTLDPVTGTWTPNQPTLIHQGPCRVRAPQTSEVAFTSGDVAVSRDRFTSRWPHNIPDVEIGDRVQIITSDDPQIGGRHFRVTDVSAATHVLYRAIGLEVVE